MSTLFIFSVPLPTTWRRDDRWHISPSTRTHQSPTSAQLEDKQSPHALSYKPKTNSIDWSFIADSSSIYRQHQIPWTTSDVFIWQSCLRSFFSYVSRGMVDFWASAWSILHTHLSVYLKHLAHVATGSQSAKIHVYPRSSNAKHHRTSLSLQSVSATSLSR